MFVVLLTYKVDLDEVDRHMTDHVAWLKAGLADGPLLAAGRQVPRTGGVLLARGESKAAVEAWAAGDPFVTNGVADAQVIEFNTSFLAPGLEALSR